ncbi:MAG: cupin domain-containing protein [Solirubrobacterales bacterium]|nr:cupin domain-containing protein [Solirubrobacterales bacterium]
MTSVGDYMLLAPAAGRRIDLGLGRPTIKVGAALSDQVGMVEGEVPPGGGFQIPHWHENLDEVFYVLEGEIEFLLDGYWRRAVAGSTVFVPAGTAHAFRNTSGRPARQLVVGSVEVAELIAELGEHPRERWEQIHKRHRSHYVKRPARLEPRGAR